MVLSDTMANKNNDKLTPELQEKFCEAIEKGHSIDGACGYVGISEQTYYNWCKKGQKSKSGKHHDFCCAVDKAKRKATYFVESVIVDNIPDNSKDAKWWLTKRIPDLYADRTYNETKLDAQVESKVTVNLLEKMKQKRNDLHDISSD